MLYIGVLSVALCAVQVISFPVSSLDTEDNTKVMKCIVEVISDTLSKPKPVPTSEDCLETLRGDERIISILRHQNLLKELQELAAQGAMERIQKKSGGGAGGFAEELSGILEKQSNKPLPSDKSQTSPLLGKSPEREEEKRQSKEEEEEEEERERKRSSEGEESTEELESNEVSKREETSEDEEIDNRITDEINDMELPKDKQEEEEEEAVSKKEQEEDEENRKQDSNETDNEEDDTQREDNSMRIPEDFSKYSESDNSKESKQEAETIDCAEENAQSDGEDASKDLLEDSKRWNKMDELAKELRAKKCASRSSEDNADRSVKIPPKEPSDLSSQEAEERRPPPPSSGETEAPILKRAEEKKEEEGSASRKTEDQELGSLAAIEAELENVAHKLHDLRRG